MKKYIILEPDVFVQIKGKLVLLYHSYNGSRLVYNNPVIAELFQQNIKGLHIYPILPHENNNHIFNELIKQIEDNNMGFTVTSSTVPIQFYPSLKIQNDYRKNIELFSKNDNSLSYLHTISIYLNKGGVIHNSKLPNNAYKQLLCNIEQGTYMEMNFGRLKEMLYNILSLSFLDRLDFLGGDLFAYSELNNIIVFLKELKSNTNLFFYLDYQSALMNIDKIQEILTIPNAKIVFCISKNSFSYVINDIIKKIPVDKIEIHCLVKTKNDIEFFENCFSQDNVSNSLFPFFNGKNARFFENNVFIRENDFDEMMLTLNQVLKNTVLNSSFYGKIIVLPNGDIFTNMNTKKIGNLFDTSLVSLLKKEMIETTSNWFLVRSKVEPCKDCIYNFLCPPISNYEFVLKCNDLCNIFPLQK